MRKSIEENWIVAIEDLYGGLELVEWFEGYTEALERYKEYVGDYPDKEGRDCLLLEVRRRGEKEE